MSFELSQEKADFLKKYVADLEHDHKLMREALEWIERPDHFEPDQYTQTACFQHRAFEALSKLRVKESGK